MSKRGRRRSNRRRKSSSSSKQSISQYIFHKPNNKDDIAEKGETDSFRKEYVGSLSEDEEKYTNCSPPKEKRSKYDYQVNVYPNQRNIYTATTNDPEKGVKIVTSVSVDDMNNLAPNFTFQQSQEPLQTNQCNTGTSIMKFNCKGSQVKLEIQEVGASGVKTTFVLCNDKREPNNDQPSGNNFSFTFSSTSEPMETHPSTNNNTILESQNQKYYHLSPTVKPLERRKQFGKRYSSDQSSDVPPQTQEFADNKLDDLILGVASCRIGACSPSYKEIFLGDSRDKSDNEFTLDTECRLDFDLLSDSDNYDPMSLRPSVSTNRSSFTKEFINCQKTKPLIRNNSIATVEHKAFLLPKKRRQTFPRLLRTSGSMQEEQLMDFQESFSSDTTSSLSAQTGRQGSVYEDRFTVIRSYNSSKVKERRSSKGYHCVDFGRQETDFVNVQSVDNDNCGRQRDVGGDQENDDGQFILEPPTDELNQRALAIQVIPPSCAGSAEQMLQSQLARKSSLGLGMGQDLTSMASSVEVTEDLRLVPYVANSNTTYFSSLISEDVSEPHLEIKCRGRIDSVKSISLACIAETSIDSKESGPDDMNKKTLCRSVSDARDFLRPMESSGSDHWAKRRKLFKESKQRSSTGEGSITSDITEGSVSEDAPSLDMTTQDTEEGGFYTETFHSAAWIYQGDNITPDTIPASLNSRSRVISIRERTVRINKGGGEYPWGFRIQFSKPIVVTEVDTNGAAEEAGLMVGDYVVAVNGTDVTSIPHSEAADLARLGPDILTLTIGSDIARGPNTPRPGCRGYLHKRTQSGLFKGWRKRWFVLTHDCCLHYYRHKRDEGKKLALSTIKLEGAEVGPDLSLGKPFVFKCRPLLANRVYFFCATSNQEMKRWIEALEKAIHPITQNHVWVDVTRHNSSLPPLAVKSPECLGLLHKMDKIKDTWVQHYCILKDACLYLYSGIRATHAHGGIYLQGYTVREQPYGSKKCTIELKPLSDEFKSFHLCAENPNDNKRQIQGWIIAIKASIKKWLPLHQALQDYNLKTEETRM